MTSTHEVEVVTVHLEPHPHADTLSIVQLLGRAEGPRLVPGTAHVREGIVVKPLLERTNPVAR